ncbi:Uncharacterised protein [Mycobacterium tuberculosis]|uniref:Uncharacterized protein n=1 Tax=Mycobacterium tuberculosis TaxID=1773 RepID=A0A654ZZ02_MYCTX|nr:transmembrane transport protein MmpL7 [Mycobacterium tuberculosis variant africanum]CFS12243.1 Uncharacterised protein [Mycobacterium tuberculosis]CFS31058.1 Uncharacterised protein [Mycobacterium tuberculosis]CKQ85093.1 Uncharacterised protein [Mycobacterium tuberculosis]CKR25907.1 Uncharacterised protein [Mycobacterium tuberculosis]
MAGVGAQGTDGGVVVRLVLRLKRAAAFHDEIGDSVATGAGESLRNPAGGGGCLGILWQQRRAGVVRFCLREREKQICDHRRGNPGGDDEQVGEPG